MYFFYPGKLRSEIRSFMVAILAELQKELPTLRLIVLPLIFKTLQIYYMYIAQMFTGSRFMSEKSRTTPTASEKYVCFCKENVCFF